MQRLMVTEECALATEVREVSTTRRILATEMVKEEVPPDTGQDLAEAQVSGRQAAQDLNPIDEGGGHVSVPVDNHTRPVCPTGGHYNILRNDGTMDEGDDMIQPSDGTGDAHDTVPIDDSDNDMIKPGNGGEHVCGKVVRQEQGDCVGGAARPVHVDVRDAAEQTRPGSPTGGLHNILRYEIIFLQGGAIYKPMEDAIYVRIPRNDSGGDEIHTRVKYIPVNPTVTSPAAASVHRVHSYAAVDTELHEEQVGQEMFDPLDLMGGGAIALDDWLKFYSEHTATETAIMDPFDTLEHAAIEQFKNF